MKKSISKFSKNQKYMYMVSSIFDLSSFANDVVMHLFQNRSAVCTAAGGSVDAQRPSTYPTVVYCDVIMYISNVKLEPIF